jgi:hypothetical protein
MHYTEYIGLYYGEPQLKALLLHLNILKKPRRGRGDDTTYLSNHEVGVELTFEDADSVEQPLREYPDGVLVLSNIRFYGTPSGDFSPFKGAPPGGIRFGTKRQELISILGKPDWTVMLDTKLRWNKGLVWLLVSLNDRDEAEIVSLQHPM